MSTHDLNDQRPFDRVRPTARLLEYGKPVTPMPKAIQWLLGVPLGLVVVTVVGCAFTASQGPIPGVVAALVAVGLLVRWVLRLCRDGYYRSMAAAVWTGATAALAVVGSFMASFNWG